MPEPALEISALSVDRGGNQILDGLDLRAERGEITALLGPNGAGKTTTIRCCCTLITPDSGTVRILGLTPEQATSRGLVGVMPQSVGAWSGIKPLEMLHYLAGLSAHPLPVDELARELGVDRFANTSCRRLSGGQQQLLNLAGALVTRPELAILDEPTAGLDPHARRLVWSLLEQLRAAGVSVLLTTHAMDEAEALADRVHIIDTGRLVVSGRVDELTREGSLEELFLATTRGQL